MLEIKQTETINHDIDQTLVVTRNGMLDDEHYDALYAERRREALKEAGHVAVGALAHGILRLGKGVVWLMTPDELRPVS